MGLRRFWKYLPVSTKLYTVIGVMALLIALELVTLFFAMNTLSSVRSFVTGESLWSKAQKDAVLSLHKYTRSRDPKYFDNFKNHLRVPLGDSQARKALLNEENPDLKAARQGFLDGKIHPEDIDGVMTLILRFHNVKHVKDAIEIWTVGDQMTADLMNYGEALHKLIQSKASDRDIFATLDRIDKLNDEMTLLEQDFSNTLGAGSRWLEHLLIFILFFAVLLVETTGLFLTFTLSRNLSRGLKELNEAAHQVGRGHFEIQVPVRTEDELGRLARSLNKMALELKTNIGQRHQAETANRVKSLFLANMSHEIRTPLSAIMGFADLLKDPQLSASEREQYVGIIQRTGESLTKIINEILDLSKVEAGHLEVEKSSFTLSTLMNEIHESMVKKAYGKSVQVDFTRRGFIPENIYSDPTRLKQILCSIIGNAIKFTEKGVVKVTYEASETQLKFTIKDSGTGIPEHQRDQLFQLFTQLDGSISRKYEGTGLGLVLSKKLAQLLGGDVTLQESTSGVGSTFVVSIALDRSPYENSSDEIKRQIENNDLPLNNVSILLIDDVEDNRLLINRVLSRRGASVALAANGFEGVQKALENDYDIILMDIQMPVMDGYTATRKLREAGYKKPIIALTAHAMKDDRERCLNAGCTDYLTKPIKVDHLIKILTTI
ncbi:Aerobic respiration control sensor protein ArcB [compost metagenome]